MKGYIDCHKCKWSHRLYDHNGKWTGAFFCTLRNGRLKKRFRKECKYKDKYKEQDHEQIHRRRRVP